MDIRETVKKYMLQGLEDMRLSIDSLDEALFHLIVERMHLVIHFGASKIKQSISFERSQDRRADLERTIKDIEGGRAGEHFFYHFFEYIYQYAVQIIEYMSLHQEVVSDYLNSFSEKKMEEYRLLLKNLDRSITNILLYRFDVVYHVGCLKNKEKSPIFDSNRWKKIIKHKKMLAVENYIDPNFIESLFDIIHEESLRIEEAISKSQESP